MGAALPKPASSDSRVPNAKRQISEHRKRCGLLLERPHTTGTPGLVTGNERLHRRRFEIWSLLGIDQISISTIGYVQYAQYLLYNVSSPQTKCPPLAGGLAFRAKRRQATDGPF